MVKLESMDCGFVIYVCEKCGAEYRVKPEKKE